MSNTQTTINTASTTYLNKDYQERKLLAWARTKFVHARFGQKRRIPEHNGTRVEFRRWDLFDPEAAMTPLAEGVTPEGQSLKQTHVEAEVAQYGAYVEISDILQKTNFANDLKEVPALLGEQLGTVVEWVTRDAMNAGTNVQYAGGKTARDQLAATDKLTVDEIRKGVRTLKKAKARMFNGSEAGGKPGSRKPHFVCICGPDAVYDLQSDPLWQDVSKYSNAEQIYAGELGRLFGVVFVESTEAKVFEGEGDSSADVYSTLMFGADAYGTIDIGGSTGAVRSIVKGLGSAGTADPLDQRATMGAKVMAYTAKILNELWILRIEHGATA